jgi:hypothetical protein
MIPVARSTGARLGDVAPFACFNFVPGNRAGVKSQVRMPGLPPVAGSRRAGRLLARIITSGFLDAHDRLAPLLIEARAKIDSEPESGPGYWSPNRYLALAFVALLVEIPRR